jgi:hypothetical protein
MYKHMREGLWLMLATRVAAHAICGRAGAELIGHVRPERPDIEAAMQDAPPKCAGVTV